MDVEQTKEIVRQVLRDEPRNSLMIYLFALIEHRWAEAEAEAVKVAGAKYEWPDLDPAAEILPLSTHVIIARIKRLEAMLKAHLDAHGQCLHVWRINNGADNG